MALSNWRSVSRAERDHNDDTPTTGARHADPPILRDYRNARLPPSLYGQALIESAMALNWLPAGWPYDLAPSR